VPQRLFGGQNHGRRLGRNRRRGRRRGVVAIMPKKKGKKGKKAKEK